MPKKYSLHLAESAKGSFPKNPKSIGSQTHGRRGTAGLGGNSAGGGGVEETQSLEEMMLQGGERRKANQGVEKIGSLLAQEDEKKPASGVQLGIGRLMNQGG